MLMWCVLLKGVSLPLGRLGVGGAEGCDGDQGNCDGSSDAEQWVNAVVLGEPEVGTVSEDGVDESSECEQSYAHVVGTLG